MIQNLKASPLSAPTFMLQPESRILLHFGRGRIQRDAISSQIINRTPLYYTGIGPIGQ